MNRYPGKRPRRQSQPSTPEERIAALRDYAIKLHDKSDGRGVDWAKVAETVFTVAFSCLDEVPGDARAQQVVRRAHDGAYTRLAGTPDSGTPYTAATAETAPFTPGSDLAPTPDYQP